MHLSKAPDKAPDSHWLFRRKLTGKAAYRFDAEKKKYSQIPLPTSLVNSTSILSYLKMSTSGDKCSKYKCRTELYRDPVSLHGTIPYNLDKIPMRRRRAHVKRETISLLGSSGTGINNSELSTILEPSQTFIRGDISIVPDGEDEGWIYSHTIKHEHAYQELDRMKVFAVAGWDNGNKTLDANVITKVNFGGLQEI
ncbi:hypothetical protein CHS0354_002554 [Potamilus streckersoni]|uniref:Uncharacterized protein n=1 Tax=Potamilus streckersoni TaxID=2493646 RepID=A0AAE0RM32_9BIVA|nr:hypothetical protein CHS0354_002554 [Potamilus streckersoni]